MKHKIYYPVNLDLVGKKCLVVGGGTVADRKARSLLEFGGAVTVVSPELTKGMRRLLAAGKIRHQKQRYRPSFLKDVFLVIAATDDSRVNASISRQAIAAGVLVNVVDEPKLCNFFVPSILRRGELVIGISTSGQSPAFAKRLNRQLKKQIGPHYGRFVRWMGRSRKSVMRGFPASSKRMAFYRAVMNSPVLGLLAKKKIRRAAKVLNGLIRQGQRKS